MPHTNSCMYERSKLHAVEGHYSVSPGFAFHKSILYIAYYTLHTIYCTMPHSLLHLLSYGLIHTLSYSHILSLTATLSFLHRPALFPLYFPFSHSQIVKPFTSLFLSLSLHPALFLPLSPVSHHYHILWFPLVSHTSSYGVIDALVHYYGSLLLLLSR